MQVTTRVDEWIEKPKNPPAKQQTNNKKPTIIV
jgi:hypothetical protein